MNIKKKIYIAGPDVFSKNSVEIGKEYLKICEEAGFEGFYPVDGVHRYVSALDIADGNFALIDKCDYVVANCNPFRGQEIDTGTACEIGYAIAKNKPVFCYMDDDRSLVEKYGLYDKNGFMYENFDFPINIMIATKTNIVKGDFKTAVSMICLKNFL